MTVVVACIGRLSAAEPSSDKTPDGKQAATADELAWPTGLEAAKRRARTENRPLLVRAGATWCGPCRELDKEIAKADVQSELRRWSLVYLDVDNSEDEAQSLDVGAIPALRVISARGKVVASRVGVLTADELLEWLHANFEKAKDSPDPLLVAEGQPDAAAIDKLTDMFQRADPLDREAAIRRLLPYPHAAAGRAVEALAKGKLSTRLAALELFREWKAPVAQFDPWRPETVTKERLKTLQEWAAGLKDDAQKGSPTLTPAAAADARRDLKRLVQLSDVEADALGERLIRLGPALLPLVAAELKDATADQARQRLLALRYRLAATDALALSWPGGLSRLAATDAGVRHKAVEELVNRATEAEQPLLLELFSDPDPLVRELSLHGLITVGGAGATDALVKLLDDPDLNVRAAVLKQLAEHPSPQLAVKVAKYVAREKDPDLLVHAIRFLKTAPQQASVDCLLTLLEHDVWQVRAEAAQALGDMTQRQGAEGQADIYAALIKRLGDSDPFVIGRAMESLKRTDLESAVDPLVQVAIAHPDLAKDAIGVLVAGEHTRIKAIPQFRKFTTSKDPNVRAAAVAGLVEAAPADCATEVLAALNDSAGVVRQSAARSVWQIYESARNANDNLTRNAAVAIPVEEPPSPGDYLNPLNWFGSGKKAPPKKAPPEQEPTDPREAWMLTYRSGKGRAEWLGTLVDPLVKMLAAADDDERQFAALALVPLGRDDVALPVLKKLASAKVSRAPTIAEALPWLPWKQRSELFNHLIALKLDDGALAQAAWQMGSLKTPAAGIALWDLLAPAGDKAPNGELLGSLYSVLSSQYQSGRDEPFSDGITNAVPKHSNSATAKDLKQRAAKGTQAQRTVALAILLGMAAAEVPLLADPIIDDAHAAPEFRQTAFRMRLLAEPNAEGEKLAVAKLIAPEDTFRRVALVYLSAGREALQELSGDPLQVYNVQGFEHIYFGSSSGVAIEVAAPAGLKPEMVRPLVHNRDPELAAAAGYLLATLGEADGLEPLLKYWRSLKDEKHRWADQTTWTRLVYRAIAATNSDQQTPVLAEIYAHRQDTNLNLGEFYWTIRAMRGPEILKLRKQIRDEVGMDNLR